MDFEDVLDTGIRMARRGDYSEALKVFDKNICFTLNPTAMSYYAMSLAVVEGDYDRAISLCLMAAEKEFYNPEIYLNLGKVLILSGRKSKAIRVFKKGLKYDDTNKMLIAEIGKLGIRRNPSITFISRRNIFNRFFGMLTAKLSGRSYVREQS